MSERGIYVSFEHRPIEDRSESVRQGRPIFRDVEYAVITVAGGNSVVERELDDELRARFKAEYDAWKAGAEPPLHGMDIREWPAITRSRAEELRAQGVRSIEDLVAVPDTALARMGIGARALQQKAQAWLDAASRTGTVAEEIQVLRAEVADLKAALAEKDAALAALKEDADATVTPRRGGRRKSG
jgi:hypothetical protein